MRNLLILLLLFFCNPAFATPQPGVNYTYQRIPHSHDILRLPDKALIPPDKKNDDYQAYLAWRKDGHKPKIYKGETK